jgi:hypothetical protein
MTATLTSISAKSASSRDQPGSTLFVAEAPVGFFGGDTNLTRYVGNNVLNLTDPFGLQAQPPVPKPPTSASLVLDKHYPPKPVGTEGMAKGAMTEWDFTPNTYQKKGSIAVAGKMTTWTFTIPGYATQAIFDETESFYIIGTDLKDPALIAHEVMHLKMAELSAKLFTAHMQKKTFVVSVKIQADAKLTEENLKDAATKEILATQSKFYAWSESFQNVTYHALVLDPKTKAIDPKKQAEWEKQYEKMLKQSFEKAFPTPP